MRIKNIAIIVIIIMTNATFMYYCASWGSSVGIVTMLRGWTVRGSNPGDGERFSCSPNRSKGLGG
jgi:hypothetical protein